MLLVLGIRNQAKSNLLCMKQNGVCDNQGSHDLEQKWEYDFRKAEKIVNYTWTVAGAYDLKCV